MYSTTIILMPIYPYAARLQGSLDRQRTEIRTYLTYSTQSTVLWLSWNVLLERKKRKQYKKMDVLPGEQI